MTSRFNSRSWYRSTVLLALASCLGAAVTINSAFAQPYPNRQVTLIAPYAAGGDSDFSGRNLRQQQLN